MSVTATTKKRLGILGAIVSIALVTSVAAYAAVSQSAPIRSFDGVDEIVEECTNTTTFVNMPQMTRTFTVGGSNEASVVAMFQGALSLDNASPFDTGFLRLRIDGNTQSPGLIPAIGVDDSGTHGFNWQTRPLTAGLHTATVQWRTDQGNTYCVDARSLIVMHR
jgi:hypothetical protein